MSILIFKYSSILEQWGVVLSCTKKDRDGGTDGRKKPDIRAVFLVFFTASLKKKSCGQMDGQTQPDLRFVIPYCRIWNLQLKVYKTRPSPG